MADGAYCQFDHVQEWGTAEGDTREANGMLADAVHHDKKTKKFLDAVINERRDVTWETLLGLIYQSKAHDYSQYSTMLREAIDLVAAAEEDEAARSSAIDRAIYQALSYRPPGSGIVADDDSEQGPGQFLAWDLIRTAHRDPRTGERINRPAPDIAEAERDRHARAATQRRGGGSPDVSGDNPSRGPWSRPNDTPPPF